MFTATKVIMSTAMKVKTHSIYDIFLPPPAADTMIFPEIDRDQGELDNQFQNGWAIAEPSMQSLNPVVSWTW